MVADEGYLSWRVAVDRHLDATYCITIEDAGLDEDRLLRHYRTNESPRNFVEWFGDKYDLSPNDSHSSDFRPPTICANGDV